MSRVVDVLRIAFFAAAVVMTVQMMLKIGNQTRMTIVDAPMNIVYGVVLLGFVALTFRSIQVAHAPLAARLQRARAADDHFRRRLG